MLRAKPTLRGVSHQYAFFASLLSGAALVWMAPTAIATAASGIYAASVTALLGTSAAYHRVNWSDNARMWMRRLDHSMIFFLIGGTYTPLAAIGVGGPEARRILMLVWIGCALGVALSLFWPKAPKPLSAVVYIAVGWAGASKVPMLIEALGITVVTLVGVGGVLYSAGAIIYAMHRPDPWPKTFGYHEIFHALVIVAAALHYAGVVLVLTAP